MSLISLESVNFKYPEADSFAMKDISLSIDEGEYIAVVGSNGSGKSTLVRLFNGLKTSDSGRVLVKGLDPALSSSMFTVRSAVALVFQSPIDQIVSSCVEEDVAFGPSNLGLSVEAIEGRVALALEKVGLTELRKRPTRSLSGGQQQKLAIAGALAMNPECLVFDEATSMLDPKTKANVMDLMEDLAAKGLTIIHVTHDMDDAARAGRILALEAGRIVFDGAPSGFFLPCEKAGTSTTDSENHSISASMGFGVPKNIEAAVRLGFQARVGGNAESLAAEIAAAIGGLSSRAGGMDAAENSLMAADSPAAAGSPVAADERGAAEPAFSFREASFSYLRGTSGEVKALSGISFSIARGKSVAFVGKTGSGKSTALQLMNSLIQPSLGSVISFGENTKSASLDARKLRLRAPLSIQRPESALFELYAADDVAFGPRNLGLSGEKLVGRVRTWMDASGIPYELFRDRLTRRLSGGEKRKLALAGVFALESEAVLLDEPTAALDPSSQKSVFGLVRSLSLQGKTVVFVTHSMEEAVQADMIAVYHEGRLADFGSPEEIFYERYDPAWGIALPYVIRLAKRLRELGLEVEGKPLNLEALAGAVGLDRRRGGAIAEEAGHEKP